LEVLKTNPTFLRLSQIPHWLLKKIRITCVSLIDRDLCIYLTFHTHHNHTTSHQIYNMLNNCNCSLWTTILFWFEHQFGNFTTHSNWY